ncbi:hypothetical protein [Paraburkholderia humisilvae]|uniref:Uncharacterized protein n=1 Tax=Paraburkholderia humisilvae TaxID=627669 RepID=A0A6J5D4W9_9BURK|nr:hypothetical protein [Paraburkholderia humisilvae]CAB3748447.1 hypothetical protein LMG29542_00666 [Paraburkholderia humisilvae]
MHFALLLSKLPHVEDARAEYGNLLRSGSHFHHLRDIAAAVWAVIRKLAARETQRR